MSLILDALKRADEERNQKNETLTPPLSHAPSENRHLPVKRWLIEILLVLSAVSVYLYFQYNDKITESITATTQAVDEVAGAEEQPDDNIVPVINNQPSAKPPSTVNNTHTKTVSKPVTNKAIDQLYQQQAKANTNKTKSLQSTTTKKKPITEPDVVAKPPPATVESVDPQLAIFNAMPLLEQMPIRFQQRVPSVEYSVHVYSEQEGSGFVMLNGKRRKVGDEIASGLRVIKILKNGVVLDYYGTQFRLLSLKSWVNFN